MPGSTWVTGVAEPREGHVMSRVGQFFERLFAGPAGKNAGLLCAYGKLPYYAEYRRLELAAGTPTTYAHWLKDGQLAWARARDEADAIGTVGPVRVLLRLPDARQLVIASLWDSRDSQGRPFPFSFFTTALPGSLGPDLPTRFGSVQTHYASFDHEYRQIPELRQGGDFYRMFRKRTLPLLPDDISSRLARAEQAALAIPADAWFAGAGIKHVDAGSWFSTLARRARIWRQDSRALADSAMGLPLAAGFPYEAQVGVWVRWIADFAGAIDQMPSLIMPAGNADKPATFYVIYRDLLADDYRLLTSDAEGYEYVERLAQALPNGSGFGGDSAPIEGPLLRWLRRNAGATVEAPISGDGPGAVAGSTGGGGGSGDGVAEGGDVAAPADGAVEARPVSDGASGSAGGAADGSPRASSSRFAREERRDGEG